MILIYEGGGYREIFASSLDRLKAMAERVFEAKPGCAHSRAVAEETKGSPGLQRTPHKPLRFTTTVATC
jgi:hypothetical protein